MILTFVEAYFLAFFGYRLCGCPNWNPRILGLWKDIFHSVWGSPKFALPLLISGVPVCICLLATIYSYVCFASLYLSAFLVTPAYSFGGMGWCETGCISATGSHGGHRKTVGASSLLLSCGSSDWTQHLRRGDTFFYLLRHLSGPVYIQIIVVFLTHSQFTNFSSVS